MYNLLLAEDEGIILDAMMKIINWGSFGFNTPIACSNGAEAIDKIKKGFTPDAVITDICMPITDGLELSQFINESCPDALIVILTGFDDFNYAYRAIKLKVYDYVLKPITPDNFKKIVASLQGQLDNLVFKDIINNDRLSRERFISKLLTTSLSHDTIEKNLKIHQIEFTHKSFAVMCIDISCEKNEDADLMQYGMCNVACELLENQDNCTTITLPTCLVVIINDVSFEKVKKSAEDYANEISKTVGETLCVKTTAGISNIFESIFMAHRAFEEALVSLDMRFFYGNVPYILYSNAKSAEKSSIEPYIEQIKSAIEKKDLDDAISCCKSLMDNLRRERADFEECLRLGNKMAIAVIRVIGSCLGRDEMQILENEWSNSSFFAAKNLVEMEKELNQLFKSAIKLFSDAEGEQSLVNVSDILKYIEENFKDEELSLSKICSAFSISISYFSAIFKEHTGTTFVKYLTNLRIEKAKLSLLYTNKRSGDIAYEVGFSDPHYFSITFKKIMGMSPKEYRESKKN